MLELSIVAESESLQAYVTAFIVHFVLYNQVTSDRRKLQYQAPLSSLATTFSGFMLIIRCPGTVSVKALSKTPLMALLPVSAKLSYFVFSPVIADHSGSAGLSAGPRSLQRVTIKACLKRSGTLPLTVLSSTNFNSNKYSVGHSGQRRMGLQRLQRLTSPVIFFVRYCVMAYVSDSAVNGMWSNAHLGIDMRTPCFQCEHTLK